MEETTKNFLGNNPCKINIDNLRERGGTEGNNNDSKLEKSLWEEKMCYRRQSTSNKAFLGFLCPIESKDKLLYFVAKFVYYVSCRQSQ